MKKYFEIKTASEKYDEPLTPDTDERDRIISELETQGHKVIMIGRAAVVIEQCEDGDVFPRGMSSEPLKITIYPHIEGGYTSSLYIHAGRYGQMEVFQETGGRMRKLKPED